MFDSKLNDSNRDVDVDIPFSDLAISNMNTEDNLTQIFRKSNKYLWIVIVKKLDHTVSQKIIINDESSHTHFTPLS